nr:hypothetical protein Clen_262 [Cedratvirus lena]
MQPEILVAIIKEMQPKDILRMSLLEPNLFDERMWKMLSSNWEYYSFLSSKGRRKFAEIAIRKSLLKAPTLRSQIWFAILNQKRNLIQDLCREFDNIKLVKSVCDVLSSEENIYFNRPMINFVYQQLGYVVSDREKIIANFSSTEKTCLSDVDYVRMHILNKDDSVYSDWVERGGIVTNDPKGHFVDAFLKEDNKEAWFFIYSITQEKEILEKIFDRVTTEEVYFPASEEILANLYRANHLNLAKRFEKKFGIHLGLELVLSCLADYYFNTGDEKGLYESLLSLGPLCEKDYRRSKMSNIEMEEITALFV